MDERDAMKEQFAFKRFREKNSAIDSPKAVGTITNERGGRDERGVKEGSKVGGPKS